MWQLSEAAQRGRQRATAANALIIFIRGSFVARTQQTADMALPLTVAEGEGVGAVSVEGRGGRQCCGRCRRSVQQARKNANKTATRLIANGCLCFAAMLLLLHVVVAAVVVVAALAAAFVAVKAVAVVAPAFVVCCYCCSCLLQLLLVMLLLLLLLLLLVLFVRWGPLSLLLLFVVCFMHPLVTFRLPFSTLFAPFICPMHIYLSQLSFAF